MAKRRRSQDPLQDLKQALRRLDKSDTPVKRRNALKAFHAAVQAIEDDVSHRYPRLRRDGTVIQPRQPKGSWCPVCRTPMKSMASLIVHVAKSHRSYISLHPAQTRADADNAMFRCNCGRFDKDGIKTYVRRSRIAAHLANHDIGEHFAEIRLKESR